MRIPGTDVAAFPRGKVAVVAFIRSDGSYCTQDCIVGASDGCPADFECVPTGGATGQCLPSDTGGGCCSVGDDGSNVWLHLGISGLVLGVVLRRRRKR